MYIGGATVSHNELRALPFTSSLASILSVSTVWAWFFWFRTTWWSFSSTLHASSTSATRTSRKGMCIFCIHFTGHSFSNEDSWVGIIMEAAALPATNNYILLFYWSEYLLSPFISVSFSCHCLKFCLCEERKLLLGLYVTAKTLTSTPTNTHTHIHTPLPVVYYCLQSL